MIIRPITGKVAIIGGGIFGLSAAMKLADIGLLVDVYEKENNILLGASYINQNRMHMGYHYPRSKMTAYSSNVYQKAFCRIYRESIVDNFDHYYCIAGEGSLTTAQNYLKFCDEIGLPYTIESPKDITITNIDLCIKVPEKLYDTNLLRNKVMGFIKTQGINIRFSTEVKNIERKDSKWRINDTDYDAVINATYGNINNIISMVNFPICKYQFELCEIVVVKVPWTNRVGCGIMDGPFFGILPFGFSEEYMIYDVEYSVLERYHGFYPDFKYDITYYDQKEKREQRFTECYLKKAMKFIKDMEKVRYLYSIYVPRVVQADRDADDARPTEVISHGNGFWSIFAGKICASIPAADEVAHQVESYLWQST